MFMFSLNQLRSDSKSPSSFLGINIVLVIIGAPIIVQGLCKVLGPFLHGRDPASCQPTLVTSEMSTDPVQDSPATACSLTHFHVYILSFCIFLGDFLLPFSCYLQKHVEYSLQ